MFLAFCVGLPVTLTSADYGCHPSSDSDVPFFPCQVKSKTVTENKEPNFGQNDKVTIHIIWIILLYNVPSVGPLQLLDKVRVCEINKTELICQGLFHTSCCATLYRVNFDVFQVLGVARLVSCMKPISHSFWLVVPYGKGLLSVSTQSDIWNQNSHAALTIIENVYRIMKFSSFFQNIAPGEALIGLNRLNISKKIHLMKFFITNFCVKGQVPTL